MNKITQLLRRLSLGLIGIVLVACTPVDVAKEQLDPLGEFKLGHTVVITKNTKKGPLSREIAMEEIELVLGAEIKRVFGGFEGSKFYHIAITVDAYVLAAPGIPLVFSPKSALVVSLNVWDDATQKMILEEPKQITVLESFSGKTFLGSGLTQTKEEQLAGLTNNAVAQVYKHLRENEALFQ